MVSRLFTILLVSFSLSPFLSFGQTNWYVDQETGDDANSGESIDEAFASVEYAVAEHVSPGDTVLIRGVYKNPSYNDGYEFAGDINDPQIWKFENTIKINELHGSADAYITFKSYDNTTIIKGDASNIFRVTNSSYLKIIGFEMEGEVNNISIETALALQFLYRNAGETESLYRVEPGTTTEEIEEMTFPLLDNVSRPSYTDTRGLYMSAVHHIEIVDNHIHHTPGTGLRVAECDYIKIIGNELDNNSRRSYSGTHALVVTKATSFDTEEGYKIFILENEVHHNYNEIFSWAPTKTIITPRIDEGKGISLQRNQVVSGWTHGRFLVANNVTYWNGFSGVHSNAGTRMDFINNTAYFNSYTNSITYEDDPAGNNIGVSTSSGDDIKIINNVIYIDATWGGFPISSASTTALTVSNNLVYGVGAELNLDADLDDIETDQTLANPQFIDTVNFNFALKESSPAIDIANASVAPVDDFYGQVRDDNPDLGAIEFVIDDASLENRQTLTEFKAYPNPFTSEVILNFSSVLPSTYELLIHDLNGQLMYSENGITNGPLMLDLSHLSKGVYAVTLLSDKESTGLKTIRLVRK